MNGVDDDMVNLHLSIQPEPLSSLAMNLKHLQSCDIVLASSSPRRRSLLEELGLSFRVEKPSTEEVRREGEDPERFAMRTSQEKADDVLKSVFNKAPKTSLLVIAADTIVIVNGLLFGKPHDEKEAKFMLRMLSGKTHEVITSVSLRFVKAGGSSLLEDSFTVRSLVELKALSSAEIEEYVATGEPMDKAGGYAIQGGAKSMVESTQGSFSNVVGLPIEELVARANELVG